MNKREQSVGTTDEKSTKVETQVSSSHSNGNTFVVGSQSQCFSYDNNEKSYFKSICPNGKPFQPDLTLEEIEKLSWFEKPYWITKEGRDWWHEKQMKKYDLSKKNKFERIDSHAIY